MPRSLQFEHYLRTLPLDERKRIEAAESEYLARTYARNAALERDFSDSLLGTNAGAPVGDDGNW